MINYEKNYAINYSCYNFYNNLISTKVQSVVIFDIYGRKVSGKFPSNVLVGWQPQADGVVIDLTVFPSGIYLVKIKTEVGEVMKKVVKN